MTIRIAQHKNGDRATTAVRRIWEDVGAAVDGITHDYGEDLLVQTCLGDTMDPSRIWVQVKGVQATSQRFRNGHGSRNVRIKLGHLQRWARGVDLVVVVLWDISHDLGWFTDISSMDFLVELGRHGIWNVDAPATARIPLPIKARDRFDVFTAQQLSWQARLDNYATHIRVLESVISHIERSNELSSLSGQTIEVEPHRVTNNHLAINAMLDLGILERPSGSPIAVSTAFRRRIEEELTECRQTPMPEVLPGDSTPEQMMHLGAIAMACIVAAQEKCGRGLDGAMSMQFGNIVHWLLIDDLSGL